MGSEGPVASALSHQPIPADLHAAILQLISAISQTADASSRNAVTAGQTMRQMESMAVSASSVSERTAAASDVAGEAVAAVHMGEQALASAQDAMALIRETSLRAARQVQVLGESAQFVRLAVGQVQFSADELHLIAGNASIEAARHPQTAGFFRNVADSIEQLAQQSKVALGEIQQAIEANRQETSRVARVIEDVVSVVQTGAQSVSAAEGSLITLSEVVGRLADLNLAIAQASQEQARVASVVAEGIDLLAGDASDSSRWAAEHATLADHVTALLEQDAIVTSPFGART